MPTPAAEQPDAAVADNGDAHAKPTVDAPTPDSTDRVETIATPTRPRKRAASQNDVAPSAGISEEMSRYRSESTSLTAFFRSFVFAWSGLVYAVRTQRNARVHALLGTLAILLGIVLRISPVEFAMIFVAITLVFIAEMFNTVAEACVDLITDEYHPLAKIAKDVAAGAVLLNAMLSVVIGLFVFVPHLWPLALRWIGH
jgi:diacylglycerol kinase